MSDRLRLLLIIAECNPEWASLPRFAYALFDALRARLDVTLVTHIRNRSALERATDLHDIVFIPESRTIARYYSLVYRLAMRGRLNWPLLQFSSYPVHAEFNRRVMQTMGSAVRHGKFHLVQAYTPITPRYPYAIVDACEQTPFILGPVNGGLPFPRAFRDLGRAEYSYMHPLRRASFLLPGYSRTYRRAAKVLAGSTYTQDLVRQMFNLDQARLDLVPEVGVFAEMFVPHHTGVSTPTRLLYVGRLVPGKGVDMLLDAVHRLQLETPGKFTLTILGDGHSRQSLEHRAEVLGISEQVHFAGWVPPTETAAYYRDADLFCFPSIRDFGGAVVPEAMAAGLPCLVADYGGSRDFVTAETGIKLSIASREQLTSDLVRGIQRLAADSELWNAMSRAAVQRAREFTWQAKADRLVEIYADTLQPDQSRNGPAN